MSDFSKLTAITIPEGVATEVKDSNGKAIWKAILARYISLGDSIAAGHAINGDWEKNYGYSKQFGYNGNTSPTVIVEKSYTDLIRDDIVGKYGDKRITALSFARSGDKVADLMAKLSNPVVIEELKKADRVTICIGANDILADAMNNLNSYINTGDISTIENSISRNMTALETDGNSNSYMSLFNRLTSINPNAEYIFTTIYNPYKNLYLEEGQNGFFKPLLGTIPQMNIDVDKIIEDTFLGGVDISYYDFSKWQWVSIELDLDLDGLIKDGLLATPAVQTLFDRVNRISGYVETWVTNLNDILREKIKEKQKTFPKFGIAETKTAFENYSNYNDLVHVAFTRGYTTELMDWGALWRDTYGDNYGQYWNDLAWKYLSFSNAAPSLNVWDYVSFNINGFAEELVAQVIEKVITPKLDPHPTEKGQSVLYKSFTNAGLLI